MTMYLAFWIVVLISVALGFPRLLGHKGNIYKALAHVWVGGLGGAALAGGPAVCTWLFWALCILEVSCFLIFRTLRSSS